MFLSKRIVYWWNILLFFIIFGSIGTNGSQNGTLLYDKLLGNYNKLVRPVENDEEKVTVKVGMTLLKIVELNENTHILNAILFLNLVWEDHYLKWIASDFGNIQNINIPIDRIWSPDLYDYNSAHPDFESLNQGTKAMVDSDGTVLYEPPGSIFTSCEINHANYPWDEQKCELLYGSWSSGVDHLDLILDPERGADTSEYVENPEWSLIGLTGRRTSQSQTHYIYIEFQIHIKRRGDLIYSQLKACNYIIWATVFLGFFYHPTSSLKIPFAGGSLLLSFWILSKLSFLTHTGKYPWIFDYFLVQTWINIVALAANILIVSIYNKTGPFYTWLNRILDYLCESKYLSPICPARRNQTFTHRNREESVSSDLAPVIIELSSRQQEEANNWKYFAIVLDRTFTIIFTTIIIFVNITLFP